MSVREENTQRNCPSRGLGIAAAAIGFGVGAAFYYFFNKRTENPDASGSTTDWSYEEQALQDSFHDDSNADMSYSMSSDSTDTNSDDDLDTTDDTDRDQESSTSISDSASDMSMHNASITSRASEGGSYITLSEITTTDTSIHDMSYLDSAINISSQDDVDMSISNDLSFDDWESVSNAVSSTLTSQTFTDTIGYTLDNLWQSLNRAAHSPRRPRPTAEIQRQAKLREQAFRERSWTLEECSICFESMQRDQEVMALPCAHRFHQPCILPWLQERQTCPNCRKEA